MDQRIEALDQEIHLIAESDPTAKRLQQLRGVGPMIATALVAAVGNAEHFSQGRQMAAALGLTPRQHSSDEHTHSHPSGLPLKALFVGMMHGMAGTGALLVLAAASVQSPLTGLIYIVLFGLGSITGMAVLSALVAVPMGYLERSLNWFFHSIQAVIGSITLAIGVNIILQIGFAGWFT